MARLGLLVRVAGAWVVLAGACAGIASASPGSTYGLAETSAVLTPGSVSITVAGAGGCVHPCGAIGGLGGRLRVGLGAHFEIGAEGGAAWAASSLADGDANTGTALSWNTRLSLKFAPVGIFALIGGVGASHDSDYGLGGDLAAILGPKLPLVPLRLYFGARIALAGPPGSDTLGGGGLTLTGAVPLGLALELPIVHVFVEGGVVAGRTWTHPLSIPLDGGSTGTPNDAIGGYALVGVGLYFGGTE